MKILNVTQECRLDQICLNHYGDLQALPTLLGANPEVLTKDLLEPGDRIQLPSWKGANALKKGQALWS